MININYCTQQDARSITIFAHYAPTKSNVGLL